MSKFGSPGHHWTSPDTQRAHWLIRMTLTALPSVPEYTKEAIEGRVCQLLNKRVSAKTIQRWREQTGFTDAYIGDREIWIIAVYGRFMAVHRRAEKAYKAAEAFIEEVESNQETANAV